jgi:hypothetical protein
LHFLNNYSILIALDLLKLLALIIVIVLSNSCLARIPSLITFCFWASSSILADVSYSANYLFTSFIYKSKSDLTWNISCYILISFKRETLSPESRIIYDKDLSKFYFEYIDRFYQLIFVFIVVLIVYIILRFFDQPSMLTLFFLGKLWNLSIRKKRL